MRPRDQFSETEWQTMLFAAFWIFEAVAGADEKIDQKESAALVESLSSFDPTPLVDKVRHEVHANFDATRAAYDRDPRDVNAGLAEVEKLLARYPNAEHAAEARRSLVNLAIHIAEASGGFLGFGSKVSKAEGEAIAHIRAIFKLPA